jgi:hypothetical protein
MARKIKVVEVENVETPSSKMKLLNPTDETPETPETVEISEAVETSSSQMKLLYPTDETPEPEQQHEETSDEKVEEIKPPKETKPQKQDEKITCSICNKTMLMKTYKYTHQKLCKPKEPEPPKEEKLKVKKQVKQAEVPSKPLNLGVVSFTEYTNPVVPDPLEVYRAAKEQRQQVRIQRVKSLISQAV